MANNIGSSVGVGALIFGTVIGVIALVIALSMAAAGIWYCFDDALARLTGISALGNISFWHMWPFTIFVASLFKTSTFSSKK